MLTKKACQIAEQIEAEAPTIEDARSGVQMAPLLQEADLKREFLRLDQMLGDTRVRYRQTQFASSQKLIDLDLEIRNALARPLSAELDLEVRYLMERLRALDPH